MRRSLAILWFLTAVTAAGAADQPPPAAGSVVAMLPLVNHTGLGAAREALVPLLEEELRGRGHRLVTAAELRPFLRANRIRTRAGVGRESVDLIAGETGCSFLLLGSLDVYREGETAEIGISLRLLDVSTGTLVAATSAGAAAADARSWFGREASLSMEELAERIVVEAVDRIDPAAEPAPPVGGSHCGRIAVVALDNYSATADAGEIAAHILLSRLVSAGYFVVEPGFVSEAMVSRGRIFRGGVDRDTAADLAETWGVCRILTGVVDTMAPGAGDPATASPRLALGLRSVDPVRGTLLRMWEIEREGSDSEHLLGLGRTRSLEQLAVAALQDVEKRLIADR